LAELNRHVVSRRRASSGLAVRFRRDARIEADLRALIAAEARCCPFLTLDLRASGEFLEVDVSGPSEARPVIEAMFGAPDEFRRPSWP
jgi:hypothetical protein